MQERIFIKSLLRLKDYCEKENFKGWDPYDGLNSKVFQATPLKNWDLARLVWIQTFKRSPMNLRKLFLVPKEYNAKGIALFLTGYCNLYKYWQQTSNTQFGNSEELLKTIHFLANLLIQLKSKGYSGSCWGYNFDWQARRYFFFPKGTPTVVVTSFCANSLLDAYEITNNTEYFEVALSSANFVNNDLKKTGQENGGFLFSYSPIPTNNEVYNASLLGSQLLSRVYHYSKEKAYLDAARKSIIAAVNAQGEDGSWIYGKLPKQNWIDSFHTGYNLVAINDYIEYSKDESLRLPLQRGLNYYINNFFLEDGTPKYYSNKIYPIDIHCAAQLIITLARLNEFKNFQHLIDKVLGWTYHNMFNINGYFYYQIKKSCSSKIPYMRWSNSFMFNALSFYLLEYSK
jgi:hypothetical protein